MLGYRRDIETQRQILWKILSENIVLHQVIKEVQTFGYDNAYVGAGCICQSVWNYQNGYDPMYGISDIDIVYFDTDLSYEKEDCVIKQVKQRFAGLPVAIDVKNEARVHLWITERFGDVIEPYTCVEEAIDTWPTTASAVGVQMKGEVFSVYAPYGLNDMFGQIIRPNKVQITKETYLAKCTKWKAKWDSLQIVEW